MAETSLALGPPDPLDPDEPLVEMGAAAALPPDDPQPATAIISTAVSSHRAAPPARPFVLMYVCPAGCPLASCLL